MATEQFKQQLYGQLLECISSGTGYTQHSPNILNEICTWSSQQIYEFISRLEDVFLQGEYPPPSKFYALHLLVKASEITENNTLLEILASKKNTIDHLMQIAQTDSHLEIEDRGFDLYGQEYPILGHNYVLLTLEAFKYWKIKAQSSFERNSPLNLFKNIAFKLPVRYIYVQRPHKITDTFHDVPAESLALPATAGAINMFQMDLKVGDGVLKNFMGQDSPKSAGKKSPGILSPKQGKEEQKRFQPSLFSKEARNPEGSPRMSNTDEKVSKNKAVGNKSNFSTRANQATDGNGREAAKDITIGLPSSAETSPKKQPNNYLSPANVVEKRKFSGDRSPRVNSEGEESRKPGVLKDSRKTLNEKAIIAAIGASAENTPVSTPKGKGKKIEVPDAGENKSSFAARANQANKQANQAEIEKKLLSPANNIQPRRLSEERSPRVNSESEERKKPAVLKDSRKTFTEKAIITAVGASAENTPVGTPQGKGEKIEVSAVKGDNKSNFATPTNQAIKQANQAEFRRDSGSEEKKKPDGIKETKDTGKERIFFDVEKTTENESPKKQGYQANLLNIQKAEPRRLSGERSPRVFSESEERNKPRVLKDSKTTVTKNVMAGVGMVSADNSQSSKTTGEKKRALDRGAPVARSSFQGISGQQGIAKESIASAQSKKNHSKKATTSDSANQEKKVDLDKVPEQVAMCTTSGRAYQEKSQVIFGNVEKHLEEYNKRVLDEISKVLVAEDPEPTKKFYTLFLLLKLSETKDEVFMKQFVEQNKLLLKLAEDGVFDNDKVGQEKGRTFFTADPFSSNSTVGKNYMLLLLEAIHYWNQTYKDVKEGDKFYRFRALYDALSKVVRFNKNYLFVGKPLKVASAYRGKSLSKIEFEDANSERVAAEMLRAAKQKEREEAAEKHALHKKGTGPDSLLIIKPRIIGEDKRPLANWQSPTPIRDTSQKPDLTTHEPTGWAKVRNVANPTSEKAVEKKVVPFENTKEYYLQAKLLWLSNYQFKACDLEEDYDDELVGNVRMCFEIDEYRGQFVEIAKKSSNKSPKPRYTKRTPTRSDEYNAEDEEPRDMMSSKVKAFDLTRIQESIRNSYKNSGKTMQSSQDFRELKAKEQMEQELMKLKEENRKLQKENGKLKMEVTARSGEGRNEEKTLIEDLQRALAQTDLKLMTLDQQVYHMKEENQRLAEEIKKARLFEMSMAEENQVLKSQINEFQQELSVARNDSQYNSQYLNKTPTHNLMAYNILHTPKSEKAVNSSPGKRPLFEYLSNEKPDALSRHNNSGISDIQRRQPNEEAPKRNAFFASSPIPQNLLSPQIETNASKNLASSAQQPFQSYSSPIKDSGDRRERWLDSPADFSQEMDKQNYDDWPLSEDMIQLDDDSDIVIKDVLSSRQDEKHKEIRGKLIATQNQVFEKLKEQMNGPSFSYDLRVYKMACLKNKCPLYDNDIVQIGITSSMVHDNSGKQNLLKLVLYYSNKANEPVLGMKASIPAAHNVTKLVKPDRLEGDVNPDDQLKQQVILSFKDAPFEYLNLECACDLDNQRISFKVPLPSVITKFIESKYLSAEEFRERWKANTNHVFKTDVLELDPDIVHSMYDFKKYFGYLIDLKPMDEYDFVQGKKGIKLGGLFELEEAGVEYMLKINLLPGHKVVFQAGCREEKADVAVFLLQTLTFLFQKTEII